MDQINNQAESVPETDPDGIIRWRNAQRLLHRPDGPAVIGPEGEIQWWFNGKLHNPHEPAVEIPGEEQEWWIHDSLHRLDGPAVIFSDGKTQWWICGIHCKTQEEVEKIKQDFGIS